MLDKLKNSHVKKTIIFALAVIIIIGIIVALWKYVTVWRYELSNDDAYIHADYVNISSEVSGYIIETDARDNQQVNAGHVLAKIDPAPFNLAVEQATATKSQAQANINELKAELDAQPDIIAEAQADVAASEASQQYAQKNMDRFGTLSKEGFATQQARDSAKNDLDQANDKLQISKAALIVAEKKTAILQAQLEGAQAALQQAVAALDIAKFNLSRTELQAPIDGVIGNRALRLGMYARAGSQILAIVPLGETFIISNYMETNIGSIKPGQPVKISVDAFPDAELTGTVNSIAPAAGQTFALLPPDNATGNFTKIVQRIPVKITIDATDPLVNRLRPGMSVTTTIITNADAKAEADK